MLPEILIRFAAVMFYAVWCHYLPPIIPPRSTCPYQAAGYHPVLLCSVVNITRGEPPINPARARRLSPLMANERCNYSRSAEAFGRRGEETMTSSFRSLEPKSAASLGSPSPTLSSRSSFCFCSEWAASDGAGETAEM